MMEKILLCADAQSCENPSLIGLEDVSLEHVPWIVCAHTARECRVAAHDASVGEVWVVSCDDMESINVAAAIKQDNGAKPVYLLSAGANGSLASRASNAHIDAVWSESALARCYADRKKMLMGERASSAGPKGDSGMQPAQGAAPSRTPLTRAPELLCANIPISQTSVLPRAAEVALAAQGAVGPMQQPRAETALALRGAKRSSSRGGTVIAVVSGSGGCGKSTLAALFALIAVQVEEGMSVAVLDADLQFGDMEQPACRD